MSINILNKFNAEEEMIGKQDSFVCYMLINDPKLVATRVEEAFLNLADLAQFT